VRSLWFIKSKNNFNETISSPSRVSARKRYIPFSYRGSTFFGSYFFCPNFDSNFLINLEFQTLNFPGSTLFVAESLPFPSAVENPIHSFLDPTQMSEAQKLIQNGDSSLVKNIISAFENVKTSFELEDKDLDSRHGSKFHQTFMNQHFIIFLLFIFFQFLYLFVVIILTLYSWDVSSFKEIPILNSILAEKDDIFKRKENYVHKSEVNGIPQSSAKVIRDEKIEKKEKKRLKKE
jgi:hypothetical protein